MYKRHTGQVSMLENPEFFGNLPLNPDNEWVKLSKLVPWAEFDARYAKHFKSRKGQPACSSRMALGALLVKERYRFSDDDIVAEIAMNPYLQYFLGLSEYRYECPFSACMMTRFRQRITPEMLQWVNDRITGRAGKDDDDRSSGGGQSENAEETKQAENEGTMILDATCAPQNIRFPTDTSLLNEARENAEELIDLLHEAGYTDGRKPRTYRETARKKYNSFSKSRKKTGKTIRKIQKQLLAYLRRDLNIIKTIEEKHPGCIETALSQRKQARLAVIQLLYAQQQEMFEEKKRQVSDRIVSLGQSWVRPIVRGKQCADVEFGAKVEMSVVKGYLRIEALQWNAFNEGSTLQASAEAFCRDYGHYPARILADKIFRTRDNLRYCKTNGIHLNGPKLGKPSADPAVHRQQLREEWLESGERGEIERDFGVGKRRYSLGCIAMKLQHTSEVAIHVSVLAMNLWKKLRILFALFKHSFSAVVFALMQWLREPTNALVMNVAL